MPEKEWNRTRRIQAQDPTISSCPGPNSRVSRAFDQLGITQSVVVAERRFNDLAREYFQAWYSSATGYEIFVEWLEVLKKQVLQDLRSVWASADANAMRDAFNGIARVLAEAGLLTEEILRNEVPLFVWDSAIAGGWFRWASERAEDIFPERLGHYWVWRGGRDLPRLFHPVITEDFKVSANSFGVR